MKASALLAAFWLVGCQQASSTDDSVTVINVPASDGAEALDYTALPDGFPILAEMKMSVLPEKCGLSKANPSTDDTRYIFTFQGLDDTQEPLYQVGINGVVRTVKQSGAADRKTKTVRYFKTIDAPDVEIMVQIETDGDIQKGIVGRIKAWDRDMPLMCGYNRIEVVGDCIL